MLVTWVPQSDGARRVPYNIHDGLDVLETVTVNQRNSPAGPDGFESLGEYVISNGTLRVYLLPSLRPVALGLELRAAGFFVGVVPAVPDGGEAGSPQGVGRPTPDEGN